MGLKEDLVTRAHLNPEKTFLNGHFIYILVEEPLVPDFQKLRLGRQNVRANPPFANSYGPWMQTLSLTVPTTALGPLHAALLAGTARASACEYLRHRFVC